MDQFLRVHCERINGFPISQVGKGGAAGNHTVRVVGSLLGWAVCSICMCWVALTGSPRWPKEFGCIDMLFLVLLGIGESLGAGHPSENPPAPLGEGLDNQRVFSPVSACLAGLLLFPSWFIIPHPILTKLHPQKPFWRVIHQPASPAWLGHPRSPCWKARL